MEIIDRSITGDYNQNTKDRVCRLINQIINIYIGGFHLEAPYSKIYFGYTSDDQIEIRQRRHNRKYENNFPYHPFKDNSEYRRPDIVYLVYKTNIDDYARKMESFLIRQYKTRHSNLTGGGGGRLGRKPYYNYLLLERMIA